MRLRRGQVVEVEFLDHCEGGGVPIAFTVWGRLLTVDPVSITVAGWTYADKTAAQSPTDPNIKCWTVLRSTIKTIRQLVAQ